MPTFKVNLAGDSVQVEEPKPQSVTPPPAATRPSPQSRPAGATILRMNSEKSRANSTGASGAIKIVISVVLILVVVLIYGLLHR